MLKIQRHCAKDTIGQDQLKNQVVTFLLWPHKGSTFLKKYEQNGQVTRPADTDPYDISHTYCLIQKFIHPTRKPITIVLY